MSMRRMVGRSIRLVSGSVLLCATLTACSNTALQTEAGNAVANQTAQWPMYTNVTAAREISRMPGLHSSIVIVRDGTAYVALTSYMSGPVSNHKTAGATFMELGSDIEANISNVFQSKFSGGNCFPNSGVHYTGSVIGEGFLQQINAIVKSSDPKVNRVLVTTDVQTRLFMNHLSKHLPTL